ncbi:MAG: TonB family protein [Sphingomonadaceae bacterium]|nr:TonB family protein [Sphingomonadaceae bacterium]
MFRGQRNKGRSWQSAIAVIAVHLALGYALLVGLTVQFLDDEAGGSLTLVDIASPAPPPPRESQSAPDPLEEGGAAPPDLMAQASPIVAAPPVIPTPSPPAPTVPIDDAGPAQGAAPIPGPGSGAGGEGNGTGRGAGGGGPGGGALVSYTRRIAGDISPRDYPRSARRARAEGLVGTTVHVGADGRVSRCIITNSSGNAALDETTCRLIRERFRYEPARNARGQAVPDVVGREQRWWLGRS